MLGIRVTPLDRGAIELTGRGDSAVVVEAPVDAELLPTALSGPRERSEPPGARPTTGCRSNCANRSGSGGSTILAGEPSPRARGQESDLLSLATPALCSDHDRLATEAQPLGGRRGCCAR